MRKVLPKLLEDVRVRAGRYGSDASYGPYGAFELPDLWIIAAGADNPEVEGWEHVSVSRRDRCPTWDEMCWVKDLFWDPDETVLQFHPPKSRYINCHPFCLHLFRDAQFPMRLPPSCLVGPSSQPARRTAP